MTRLAAVALFAAALAVACGVPGPERWEQRGFDSEAECWLNHGWDGTVSDGVDRNAMFDFWCGPITD